MLIDDTDPTNSGVGWQTWSRRAAVLTMFMATTAVLGVRSAAAEEKQPVRFVTTKSFQETGLLEVILPLFTQKTGWPVKIVTTASPEVIAMVTRGEADVVLVNLPGMEEKLISDGDAQRRRRFAETDFLLAGPPGDPVRAKAERTAIGALRAIAKAQASFFSRGDGSAVHEREKFLWRTAGAVPAKPWYIETGTGMADTLRTAAQRSGYVLTDRGTFASLDGKVNLVSVVEGDRTLINRFSVLETSVLKHPDVNARGGRLLAGFLVSEEVRRLTARFGIERFGRSLFIADSTVSTR